MRRHWVTGATLLAVGVAAVGCGGGHPQASSDDAPATVQARLLRRLAQWKTTRAAVTETSAVAGGKAVIRNVTVTEQAGDGDFRERLSQATGSTLWLSNGHAMVAYANSSTVWLAPPPPPTQTGLFALVGPPLAQFVQAAKPVAVAAAGHHRQTLTLAGTIPGGAAGTLQVTFDWATNAPLELVAQWDHQTVTETVQRFQNFTGSTGFFDFSWPRRALVVAEPALTVGGPLPTPPRLGFFPVLPPFSASVTLTDAATALYPRPVLLLTYTASDGSPLVLTEFAAGSAAPSGPAGVHLGSEAFGPIRVADGNLPDGQAFASFVIRGTEVWLEGGRGPVASLLASWLPGLSAQVSVAPSTGAPPPTSP